jgi:hypothetical protein
MIKCKKCGKIISQCRCMAKDKEIEWSICDECAKIKNDNPLMDNELDQHLQSKKVFRILTTLDIREAFQCHKIKLDDALIMAWVMGTVEMEWKKAHERGEIWWYYDIGIMCGTAGLIMIEDGKIVKSYVIWRS